MTLFKIVRYDEFRNGMYQFRTVSINTVICACYPRCFALATTLSFPCWIQAYNLFAYKTNDSRITLPRHVVYPLDKASELQKWYSPSSEGSLQRCLFKALLRFVQTSQGKDRIWGHLVQFVTNLNVNWKLNHIISLVPMMKVTLLYFSIIVARKFKE
jgi:hypothetical protein